MSERIQLMLKVLSTHIVLPIIFMVGSFLLHFNQILLNTIAQTVIAIVYFAGYWEFFGLRFRLFFCFVIEAALHSQVFFLRPAGIVYTSNSFILFVLSVIQLYLLLEFIKILIVRFYKMENTIDIAFPFKGGIFLVTDGGNSKVSRLMNCHFHSKVHRQKNTNVSMMFATDIIMLGKNRYVSFFPRRNEQYPVFGEQLYTPMDGEVVKVENNIPDNTPYSGDYPYSTGNTIVIKKENLYLLLGHLQQKSILVHQGDRVKVNDIIARAGNSGMSEMPHIHLQLMESNSENYWKGKGVNISFEGKPVYKNKVIKKGIKTCDGIKKKSAES